jgi:tripartite-type tricarboxylate transporter receptor subunit TctC
MVPPKTPKDRLLTLRTALQKTLMDPQFLADARKSKLVIENVTGEDVEGSVKEILSISPSVKKKLAILLPGHKPEIVGRK